MDVPTNSSDQDIKPPYSTSKQVQAWFLRRSRDLWKDKYAELRLELKRLRQRVADIDRSRAQWRRRAEDAGQELEALQAEIARLRTAPDSATDAGGKNARPARPL
jgi:septal ring factor EnvC (AmiA/AmiB activator)